MNKDIIKDIIKDLVKISELNAKNIYDIKRIAYENEYLVPCVVDIREEEVEFTYDTSHLKKVQSLKNARDIEKLRFLINISNLFSIGEIYSFNINSDNLYYDYNYNPKVLKRDIKLDENVIDHGDRVSQYKSLIGCLFISKYSYDDFYNGGIKLLKANKITKDYIDLNSISEIREKLLAHLEEVEKYNDENLIEVKKKDYKIKKHSIRIMGVAIAGLAIYSVYAGAFLNPFNKNVIKANYAYMDSDYEKVIQYLEGANKIKMMKLDKNSKYELAYAYITSENLSENQRKNILINLTSKSDENLLDYWIAVGEVKYDEAIDLAKKLQDNELILYALLNKGKYIQDDTTLTGEEKEKAQQSVKSEIEKITEALTKDDGTSGLNDNTLNNAPSSEVGSGSAEGLNLVPGSN